MMKHAIIIGATAGIGRALTEQLAGLDYRVGITGRRENLLHEIQSASPDSIVCEKADITDLATSIAALERLHERLGEIHLCIICAGVGFLNERLDFALEEPTLRTNVLGWTAAVDWIYGLFERQNGGHLVVLSSVGGIRGSRIAPAYNASKAYQMNYTEGLRQKAKHSKMPIIITDLRPGLTDTEMAKGEGLFWVMPVDKVTRQILSAIKRKRAVAVVTKRWKIMAFLLRHLPDAIYNRM